MPDRSEADKDPNSIPTPRTDAEWAANGWWRARVGHAVKIDFARQLERELAEAKAAVNVAMHNHADAENRAARPSLAAQGAEAAILEHNAGCEASCKAQRPGIHGQGCGYQDADGKLIYKGRNCPHCPLDWKIDFAPSPRVAQNIPGLEAASEMFANHEKDLFTRSEAITDIMKMIENARISHTEAYLLPGLRCARLTILNSEGEPIQPYAIKIIDRIIAQVESGDAARSTRVTPSIIPEGFYCASEQLLGSLKCPVQCGGCKREVAKAEADVSAVSSIVAPTDDEIIAADLDSIKVADCEMSPAWVVGVVRRAVQHLRARSATGERQK